MADRLGAATLPATQECLGRMLGALRTTVTKVASELQRQKIIEYARGQLTILDRPKLEASACPCYRETRRLFAALYGDAPVEAKPHTRQAIVTLNTTIALGYLWPAGAHSASDRP